MSRSGLAALELLVVVAVGTMLILPVLSLSSRNVEDHQEVLERSLAQGLCLDMMERFKRYKTHWPLPGSPPRPPLNTPGPPLREMFGPVEMDASRGTLFDKVYLEQLAALGMALRPKIEKTPDPTRPGLFRLDIAVSWRNARGYAREVKFSRYCFAP